MSYIYPRAELGRRTAAEPRGMVDGSRVYAYVRGSLIRFSDPNGTKKWEQTLNDLIAQGLKSTDSTVLEFSMKTLHSAAASGRPVIFDLTHMQDIPGVLSGAGRWAVTVTGAELRYIQTNWAQFQKNVTFIGGAAPW